MQLPQRTFSMWIHKAIKGKWNETHRVAVLVKVIAFSAYDLLGGPRGTGMAQPLLPLSCSAQVLIALWLWEEAWLLVSLGAIIGGSCQACLLLAEWPWMSGFSCCIYTWRCNSPPLGAPSQGFKGVMSCSSLRADVKTSGGVHSRLP